MKDLDFLIYIWGICAYNCDAFSGNHGTSGDREAHSVWRVAACSRLCVTQISWNGKKLHGGPKSHVCVGLCKQAEAMVWEYCMVVIANSYRNIWRPQATRFIIS